MKQAITGFHRDDEGDWVAELSCGHNQHVRHNPPFVQRPWVIREAGRAGRLGTLLPCPLCDRAAGPEPASCASASGVLSAGRCMLALAMEPGSGLPSG